MDLHHLPTLNACLNATAFVFLILGWRAIKNQNRKQHKQLMIAALVASALFLCSYMTYHTLSPGPTRYEKEGMLRILYFFILFTHIPLAMIIVPACCVAVWHAIKGNFERHVRITRWLWPTWMYVSITGVLIYVMLYLT